MQAEERRDNFSEYDKGALLGDEYSEYEIKANTILQKVYPVDMVYEMASLEDGERDSQKLEDNRSQSGVDGGRISEIAKPQVVDDGANDVKDTVDTSAIEEEISIIDEALKDESLSSADRVALIKEKVRLQRELSGRHKVYLTTEKMNMSLEKRKGTFPEYEKGALLWNENVDKNRRMLRQTDTRSMASTENQKISAEGSGGVQEKESSDLQRDLEEEISIIDEALKDKSLPSADRVALIKDKVRLQRELSGGHKVYLTTERMNMSLEKRKGTFPEYEKGALLWNEKESGERRKNENSEFDIRREQQGIAEQYFGTEKGRNERGRVSEVPGVSSALEEEISIIDEALKDKSLPSSDRIALIKDKVRLMAVKTRTEKQRAINARCFFVFADV